MLKAGASGYLLKDCALEDLVRAIRTVIGHKTYLSPGISDVVIKEFVSGWEHADPSGAFSVLTAREREVLQQKPPLPVVEGFLPGISPRPKP